MAQPFSDRPGVIWYNGEFVPWKDATIHVLSHGLHYGSGVFEGERAYGGTVFKLDEHMDRLFGAIFDTTGQICMNAKRVYVHRSRMDELVNALSARLQRLKRDIVKARAEQPVAV